MADEKPAAAPSDGMHTCPGGCGARVPRQLFACKPCWGALPFVYRREITETYSGRHKSIAGHLAAMVAARGWYRDRAAAAKVGRGDG